MVEYTVFWDYLEPDGWGAVTSLHRSPHRLDPQVVALGAAVEVGPEPRRKGWNTAGWVNPAAGAFEWRMTRDPDYNVAVSEYLAALPSAARVSMRAQRGVDANIEDFMALLEMAVQEGRGFNPHGRASREGLGYLVAKGLLAQDEADHVTDAAND